MIVTHYKNLPRRPEKDVIDDIKSAMEYDNDRFAVLKQVNLKFIRNQTPA